jgi:RNA polymerase sigma-70 factor (ECF subfamily)
VTTVADARPGDEAAFTELVAPHRAALLAHCYRMTGSLHDAEDALQDTMLRAWKAFDQFEGRSSLRTWLFTVATNACRRLLERRSRRVLPIDFGPPTDPHGDAAPPLLESTWVSPFPGADVDDSPAGRYESKESVELAFVAALQWLPSRQRAVLLLRDVLAFSAAETATALDTTPASVNSALQRAHKAVEGRLPDRSQQSTLRTLGDDAARDVVMRFVDAWDRHDIDALVALLAADVELSMPPMPTWFRGVAAVKDFLLRHPFDGVNRWRGVPVDANGQLACALYRDADGTWTAHSINVLAMRGGQIAGFHAHLDPTLFPAFGLPDVLEPAPG